MSLEKMWKHIEYLHPMSEVIAVYDGGEYTDPDSTDSAEAEKTDSFGLLPGQVKIKVGYSEENAWVVMPYGMRMDMKGSNREQRTSNQPYGTYMMPRVGDLVFAIGYDFGDSGIDEGYRTEYYVLGVMGSTKVTRPPPTDKDDMQMVHRSGASIRLNDTYAGGGAMTTTGDATGVAALKGITGNLTMVGNRTMIFAGKNYLSHGHLAKYGDPRKRFRELKIQTRSTLATDNTYGELFSNNASDSYYDPFDSQMITNVQKFLSPPSTEGDIIPLTDNTLLLAQQGGGVFRIDDHSASASHSRITVASASMSFMVGTAYKELGLSGDSSSVEDASGIGGDGNAGLAGDVGTGTNTYEVHHSSGTRVTIDEDGTINIFTRDPNATIHIDTEDDARIYIGEGEHPVVRSDDVTAKDTATAAIMGPPDTTIGCLGFPIPHMHNGHTHIEKHTQEKTYV